ncbi:hypothetical protein BJ165DRAFT_1497546 [Panaeolus papilionaceus]|nr:hypothetical protein BJ165DRAFT_1497546 [Panaeolus papilionaceus]
MRAASVTASGSNASLLSDARNERDRKKLRKTRGGAVQGGVTGVPGGQQQDDKTPVPKKTPTTNEPAGVVTPVRRAPSQAVRPAQQQQGQQGPPTKTGLSHRRSASIDVGVQQRRSFVESEARKTNAENEMRRGEVSHGSGNHSSGEGDRRSYADASSENGTVNGIVDLGSRRRRAASEAGRRELQQYGAMDNVPPVPSHEPVLMGYVPTAPGSVLGTVHVQPTPVHVERTPAPPAPKPIHLEPYVRPKEAQTSAEVGGAQRATSILKTRKSSSDVGQPTTSASTTAYPPPMPMKTPTAPPPVVAQTSTSPPLSRRQSTRAIPATSTSSPSKAQPQLQAQITSPKKTSASPSKLPTSAPPSKLPTSATSPNRATVLPAGGDHPSGILVAQAGWNAPQSTLTGTAGGAISRNTSVRSAASAPSGDGMGVPQSRGAAGKRQKQSVLGQGMPTTTISGGVGRHASLGHTSGVVMGQQFQQQYPPAQQQQQTSPQSLLKIIEDVANVNKKGPLSGGIGIPSAPPRVLTEKLKAMDQDAFRSQLGASPIPGQRHGATHGARTKAPSTATTTTTASQGLWEIKAPGSVWDQRQALMEQQTTSKKPSGIYNKEASMSAPDLTLSGVSRSRSVKSPRPVAAAAGGGQMPNGNVTGSHSASSSGVPQPAKMPLRSAMRHPSRTPSPLVSGSPHARAGSGPASTSSYNSPLTRHEPLAAPATSSPQHQPSPLVREVEKKKDKGKQKAVEPEQEDTGAESSAYETGNEAFYTDEESGAEGRWKEKEKKPILAAPVPFGGPSTLSGMNGHAVGYGASDVSRSDTSTGTPRASSDQQQPRRRKSVRVSLKPTFSPSPPAIEYDEYEEQERHAPWAWGPKAGSSSQYDSIEKRASEQPGSSSSLYNPAIASPAPQAPAKQHAIVKQQKAESSKDIWEDSSDDDEAYFKAKKALSEAAKFEKDVTLMVANRRF